MSASASPPERLIAAQWVLFKELLPPGTPAAMEFELRQAFFSGAMGMLATLTGNFDPDTQEGFRLKPTVLAGLMEEARAFLTEPSGAGQA